MKKEIYKKELFDYNNDNIFYLRQSKKMVKNFKFYEIRPGKKFKIQFKNWYCQMDNGWDCSIERQVFGSFRTT